MVLGTVVTLHGALDSSGGVHLVVHTYVGTRLRLDVAGGISMPSDAILMELGAHGQAAQRMCAVQHIGSVQHSSTRAQVWWALAKKCAALACMAHAVRDVNCTARWPWLIGSVTLGQLGVSTAWLGFVSMPGSFLEPWKRCKCVGVLVITCVEDWLTKGCLSAAQETRNSW
ncbi:hypothetical protein FNV43_RR04317 [Rhamnella rubrinervis]|uniref:Uncharacterized protein n=1 Tax=Rhamnella rubrinervis TaxID=2594499 RepID=A0A8K0MPG3_9ROSA|nr:hypothetical protein FNV43_RR04317 [Rhamnella rubrinervis]